MSFLGIKIPHETARLLSTIDVAGDKCDSGSFHITLLCFEEEMAIKDIAKSMISTFEITSKEKPFTATVNHVTCFPEGDDGFPVICPVKSKELFEFREKLAKIFDKNKIKYSKKFDFNPHITLSYSEDKIHDLECDELEFNVGEIVLWGGSNGDDRVFITFPLSLHTKKASKISPRNSDALLFASKIYSSKASNLNGSKKLKH